MRNPGVRPLCALPARNRPYEKRCQVPFWQVDGEMGRFGQWLTLTHTQRYHAHYRTIGEGHVYQRRYKSFPVQDDGHFLTVCRYVERNAYAAEFYHQPDEWRYSSLWRWRYGTAEQKRILSPWPVPRLRGWLDWVKKPLREKEDRRLKQSIQRGCPFGHEDWTKTTARRLAIESTLRSRGRPRKAPNWPKRYLTLYSTRLP